MRDRDTAETHFRAGAGSTFRTTRWTVVLEAAQADAPEAHEAFALLYRDYWPPLYAYLRRRGFSPPQSEDIAQDFFCHLLEKRALANLRRDGAHFRSFLLACMENFLANKWDRDRARKRGGGQVLLSLDAKSGEAGAAVGNMDDETPESLFAKQWVFTLLDRVMERLLEESRSSGKDAFFQDVRLHLQGERRGLPYSEVAVRHGMSEGAVKVAVHRQRQRYGQLLREEIARTVGSEREVDEELRYLISIAGR